MTKSKLNMYEKFRCSSELRDRLDRAAKVLGVDRSGFVREASEKAAEKVLATEEWLVYRVGMNAANQGTQRAPVAIVTASSYEKAVEAAEAEGISCYHNQAFDPVHRSEVKEGDWEEWLELEHFGFSP